MPYFVYITTNPNNTVLYTGVTRDLKKRIAQHKLGSFPGFTQRYKAGKLVYYETFDGVKEAITREKQIKGGSRQKKFALIIGKNRGWVDLSDRI
jgi:putative endonuclease